MDELYEEMICQNELKGITTNINKSQLHILCLPLSSLQSLPPSNPPSLISLELPQLYKLSSNIALWSALSFYLAVVLNLIVLFFYPFQRGNQFLGNTIIID